MGGEFGLKGRTNDKARERVEALTNLVCAIVSIEFGVQASQLITRNKGPAHVCFARQVAMYLVHVVYQIRIANIARVFGRDPSTVSHACHTIEEARDDQVLDSKLATLEDVLDIPSFTGIVGTGRSRRI